MPRYLPSKSGGFLAYVDTRNNVSDKKVYILFFYSITFFQFVILQIRQFTLHKILESQQRKIADKVNQISHILKVHSLSIVLHKIDIDPPSRSFDLKLQNFFLFVYFRLRICVAVKIK